MLYWRRFLDFFNRVEVFEMNVNGLDEVVFIFWITKKWDPYWKRTGFVSFLFMYVRNYEVWYDKLWSNNHVAKFLLRPKNVVVKSSVLERENIIYPISLAFCVQSTNHMNYKRTGFMRSNMFQGALPISLCFLYMAGCLTTNQALAIEVRW